MAFTYDPTTDRGQVRLLLADTNVADATLQIFTDAEIDAFLSMEGSVVLLAAARGAESIASSELYIQKKNRTLDVQTDGPAIAKEWREKAKAWRDQYDAEGAIDIAEEVHDDFSYRQRLINEGLRS